MNDNQKLPATTELIRERAELLQGLEQSQQQLFLVQQRIAFLNGVLTERGVDLNDPTQVQNSATPKRADPK